MKTRGCAKAIYRGIIPIEAVVLALIGFGCTRPGASPSVSAFDYQAFVDATRAAGATAARVGGGTVSQRNANLCYRSRHLANAFHRSRQVRL